MPQYRFLGTSEKESTLTYARARNKKLHRLVAAWALVLSSSVVPPQLTPAPVVRNPIVVYSTFLGGAEGNPDDGVSHVAVDSYGNFWVTGTTDARDFPTFNAQQPECALGPLGGCRDVFAAKFDARGSLVFSTYLGSDNNDESGGMVTDSEGNAYLTGTWGSTAFVAKLDPGGRLLFHYTFPGSPNSYGRGIAIDRQNNIYIVGEAFNLYPQPPLRVWPADGFVTMPRTPSCFAIGGGSFVVDTFVVKLDSSGRTLFAFALGGNGNDAGTDIAVDTAGNIWVLGSAGSADFPTKDPLQEHYGGGEGRQEGNCSPGDVFVTKIDPTGSELLYSTFLGGGSQDQPHSIEVDWAGNAYVAWTGSSDSLEPRPCHWVTKLDPSGQRPVYSQCLQNAETRAVAIDPLGNAYLTGAAGHGMPTAHAFQDSFAGGGGDAFVAKLDPGGTVRFCSYLGGSRLEGGAAIAASPDGEIYVAGATDSADFPTLNPAQEHCAPDFRGGCSVDGFVTRISFEPLHIQQAAIVSSASFAPQEPLAPDSIASAFGEGFAETTEAAEALPLPASLAGTAINISDAAGIFHRAELLYVSPEQINFLIPSSVALGTAEAWVVRQGEVTARTLFRIDPVAPALFTANATGQGPAVALAFRSGFEPTPLFHCAAPGDCYARPINLRNGPVFLMLFGTGIRGRSSLDAVLAQVGSSEVPVTFAGPQPEFVGLDQINVGPLPATLAGSGEVEIILTVEGVAANRVTALIE